MDAGSPTTTPGATQVPDGTAGPGESPADAERRRRPQMPYSPRPLIEVHGHLGAVREQMLEISTLMKERTLTQKAASNLRFLTPPSDDETGTCPPAGSNESAIALPCESRETCSCRSVQAFHVALDPAADVSRSAGDEQFACLCENTTDTGLVLVKPGLFPNCRHYVGVSYCWEKATDAQSSAAAQVRATSPLQILDKSTRSGDLLRSANAPPHVLRRAVRYAGSKGCGLVWIDQECIHQQDRDDKENGIQSMDAVYGNSLYPVAILNTRIQYQEHLDAVGRLVSPQIQRLGAMIMSGELASDPQNTSPQSLLREIPWTAQQQLWMLDALIRIVSDRWFTRSWITQELICSNDMVLLLEFDPSLTCPEGLESWSDGEIRISVKQLLAAIWWSIMPQNVVSMAEMPEARSNILSVFWKLFPFVRPIPGEGSRNTCSFLSAWNLIQSTQNSRIADRLAIMGNLCDYPVRINSVEAETRALNYSTCMITQALLNGDLEVLLHRPALVDFRGAVASRASRFFPGRGSWLRSLAHYPIESPGGFGAGYDSRWPPAYFKVCGLSGLGLACQGRLWKVSKEINLHGLQRSIRRRNFVYGVSMFLVDLPLHVFRGLLLFIRRLAAGVGMRRPFEGSIFLEHPRLQGDAGREKRIERTRNLHFLRDFRAEFHHAQSLRMSGRAPRHPLGDIKIPIDERLGNPLLDGVDLQRLGWLGDRVEDHGRLWGAAHVSGDSSPSSQVSAIFDCGEVEDEETEVGEEEDDIDCKDEDETMPEPGEAGESRPRPPLYVFTPHADALVQHPCHSVQFRATSWVVEIVEGKRLRCKDLVYGLYDYGNTEPAEYTLSWD